MQVVSFDLDSTVCDTTHRSHLIHEQRHLTDWQAYSLACVGDGPGPAYDLLLYMEKCGLPYVVCSRRDYIAFEQTKQWFSDRNLRGPIDWMLLNGPRSSANRTQSGWKVEMLQDYEKRSGFAISLHIDDSPIVIDGMKKAGYGAVLVHSDNDAEKPVA